MKKMHETTERLFAAVEVLDPGRAITSEVARRLNVGDNLVTNWKTRGVSFEGAIRAEAAYGIPAAWVMSGNVPPIHGVWPFSADFSAYRALDADKKKTLDSVVTAFLSDPSLPAKGMETKKLAGMPPSTVEAYKVPIKPKP